MRPRFAPPSETHTENAERSSRFWGSSIGQLVVFFSLTLGFSWIVWAPVTTGIASSRTLAPLLLLVGGAGPLFATFVMLKLNGNAATRWVVRTMFRSFSIRGCLAAAFFPVGAVSLVVVLHLAMRGHLDLLTLLRSLANYPIVFLIVLLVGGGHEEFGWRGFALPRLQQLLTPLQASLLIGGVWGVWHLPLFYVRPSLLRLSELQFGPYLVAVIGISVVFTWLYNATGETVLIPMLAHAGINAVSWKVLPIAQAALGNEFYTVTHLGLIGGWWVVAITIIIVTGGRLAASPDP